MNQQPRSTEDEAEYQRSTAEHDLRKTVDRAAGLYNDQRNSGNAWREFLEKTHAEIFARWPEIHDAMVDARRWENPCHFNGTFAEKVARAAPLPAISTVGQMERIIMRTLVMMDMPGPERERLIKLAYDAEKEAQRLCAEARTRKLGVDDIDLTGLVM